MLLQKAIIQRELLIQHTKIKRKHQNSFTSNNKHLFTNILTTEYSHQGRRAFLKPLSYVFEIHSLPFSYVRQDKLPEFGIQVMEISYNKTLDTDPLIDD